VLSAVIFSQTLNLLCADHCDLTRAAGALCIGITRKVSNLNSETVDSGLGVVGDTYIRDSNVTVNNNIISHCHIRLRTVATTFGSTANGGAISVFAGSSGFTGIAQLSTMGSTDVQRSVFSLSNNSIVHCKVSSKILFGRSNGADVRGGGISFFVGFTAVSFVSGNWRVGFVKFLSSLMIFIGNVFSNCSASTESDSFAFASSAHGGALSLFIGDVLSFLPVKLRIQLTLLQVQF
jgi:hypothetical protein